MGERIRVPPVSGTIGLSPHWTGQEAGGRRHLFVRPASALGAVLPQSSTEQMPERPNAACDVCGVELTSSPGACRIVPIAQRIRCALVNGSAGRVAQFLAIPVSGPCTANPC